MTSGLPFISHPRPVTRALKPSSRNLPELIGSLEPSQGRAAYEQALRDWGFSLLPGLQPVDQENATLWFHPKGVLLVDCAFVNSGSVFDGYCEVLAVLDMGFYHNDNDVIGAGNSARHTGVRSSNANLRQDTDGRTYQQIHFTSEPYRTPAMVKEIQSRGRLGTFEQMKRAGELGDWPGRKLFEWASVSRWDVTSLPADLPPGLKGLLEWVARRAPVDEARQRRVNDSSDLSTLLRNQAKSAHRRYGYGSEGEESSLWGRQAVGEADYQPNFTVHRSGLTQATCLAVCVTSPQNASRLSRWVEQAPLETLRLAVSGNPRDVPPLPALLIHQLGAKGEFAPEWDATVVACGEVWATMAARLGPQFLEAVWQGNRIWADVFSSDVKNNRLNAGFGQALVDMAKASASAGFRWPELSDPQWKALKDRWPESQWKPIETLFRQWALADSLSEEPSALPRRPRF